MRRTVRVRSGRHPDSVRFRARTTRPPSRAGVLSAFGPQSLTLRGASIGIGPEGSGTAYLARLLLDDADLAGLNLRTSCHELEEQAQLVAQGSLDLAAYVMRDDAE